MQPQSATACLWKLNDGAVDFTANTYFSSGTIGARRGIGSALERSQNIWSIDPEHKNAESGNIATAAICC